MDWTQILILVIALITTVLVGLVTKQLVPWLKERNLHDAAIVAVGAAEALYGRYHGDEKLSYALDILKEKGYNIDTSMVLNALKAAWKQLDIAMIDAGAKDVPEEKPE